MLLVNIKEINVKLIGNPEQDFELAGKLLDEIMLLLKVSGRGEEQDFEIGWKQVSLMKRCNMLAVVHKDKISTAEALMEKTIETSRGAANGGQLVQLESILSQHKERKDKTAMRENNNNNNNNPAPSTPSSTPMTDSEAMDKILAFYKIANPSKTQSDVKRIWAKNRTNPQALHKKYLKAYPKEAEKHLKWLATFTPTGPPADASPAVKKAVVKPPPATPKVKKSNQRTASTPGGGVVAGLIGAIASPVVKLFKSDADEPEVPQAILPTDEDESEYYFDEQEKRWIFRNDPEGEAERKALAEAKKGPPPKPVGPSHASVSAPSRPGMKYVDPFNSGAASSEAAGPAGGAPPPPMPPMPPMPVFSDDSDSTPQKKATDLVDSRDVVS